MIHNIAMVEGEERRTCCTTVSLRVGNDSATVLGSNNLWSDQAIDMFVT